ncbi:2-keto-4-pentenoate hydratase/2-oxohepta-3-ene-1,7-dioic acid hydratase [Microbacterium sp. C448]|uniref:fumarylacetoacetate hydrolase family protein n=1 Tax=Microbacterium TaxID=33882 RepID=UPI0003DE6D05|nr:MULTISPECIES: fumarylacetoacetate hydrolase family protein [Microbacterium]CDJ99654.1 2-keto-4-pentenoate hydratase/2-oxohepta-3-ene-1,7-dioic acid hydratase [Microbacterium sp. C448]
MRIARWRDGDTIGEGFVEGSDVVSFPRGRTVASVLAEGLDAARALHTETFGPSGARRRPLADVDLLAPVVPPSVRDFVTFEEHVEGVSAGVEGKSDVPAEWYGAPTFYFTNPHTILAPSEPVRPPVTERLDFELELAVVIGAVPGSDGSNLDAISAAPHIFGYTIMNDWSARDLQAREMKVRLGPCKGKDFGTTLGPWIVTADELEGYLDEDGFLAVHAEVRINDELIGEDLVSNMGWPFPELVAYASRNSRVMPGDVLGSGTVGNGGCLGELWGRNRGLTPPPLQTGDVVRMVIEGIGEIESVVGEQVAAPPLPSARVRSRARTR